MNKLLLFLGWIFYWLKEFDKSWKKHKSINYAIEDFYKDNLIELLTSFIGILVIYLAADEVSIEYIDLRGKISTFLAGFGSSSFINGLISRYRK